MQGRRSGAKADKSLGKNQDLSIPWTCRIRPMELKPSKGIKVTVNAHREAVFGDESVSVRKVSIADGARGGAMTGQTLAGFCEVEMPKIDGAKHWYPISDLVGENGEAIVEEEIPIEEDEAEAKGVEVDAMETAAETEAEPD